MDGLALPPQTRAAATEALGEAEAEAAAPKSRSKQLGDSLRRVTNALGEAGALTYAGAVALRGALALVTQLA